RRLCSWLLPAGNGAAAHPSTGEVDEVSLKQEDRILQLHQGETPWTRNRQDCREPQANANARRPRTVTRFWRPHGTCSQSWATGRPRFATSFAPRLSLRAHFTITSGRRRKSSRPSRTRAHCASVRG